jgi:hypothetical protein
MVRTRKYWKRPWNEYSWQQQVFVLGLLASPLLAYYNKDEEFREVFDHWYENGGQELYYLLQDRVLADRQHFVSDEDIADEQEQLVIEHEMARERSVDYLISQEPPKPLELATSSRMRQIVFPWDWPTVKAFLLYPWRPVDLPPSSSPSESESTSDQSSSSSSSATA